MGRPHRDVVCCPAQCELAFCPFNFPFHTSFPGRSYKVEIIEHLDMLGIQFVPTTCELSQHVESSLEGGCVRTWQGGAEQRPQLRGQR